MPAPMTDEPSLGLATTRQLLDEIRARIEIDHYRDGGGLDYRTADTDGDQSTAGETPEEGN